ncbi:HIT family protein [Candidatus Parcubacteria bacterium]|jgi:histidine triad (HIT) family protein|nr:HIT family protein [Candidatus Parcubacteria bacterium]MBT3949367.1 HIT family protein [Candidatus Parcubacteria bacterium]
MEDCIFCKILKGEIPNHTVYEDKNVLAFLDIYPHAKGHTIVIPKVHAETYFDLNEELLTSFSNGVKRAMENVQNKLQPDGFNVGWNQNKVAGQVVPHLHMHIIPRYEGDGGGSIHSIIKNPGEKTVDEISKLFE